MNKIFAGKKKWIFVIPIVFILLSISCKEKRKKEKFTKKKEVVFDDKVHEFYWYKKTSDYYGKRIAIYGFVWLDSITQEIGPNRFTIYERPNCYMCGETMVQTDVKIPVITVEDTSFNNENKGAQWRLVKITARADNYQYATIERFELSEYSYPDYIESGYEKIRDDFGNRNDYSNYPAYIEGWLKLNVVTFNSEYVSLRLKHSGLHKDIAIYIKSGKGPNTANPLPDQYTEQDLIVRDKHGMEVQNKRLRLFGRYESNTKPEFNANNIGNLYVEMIEVIK